MRAFSITAKEVSEMRLRPLCNVKFGRAALSRLYNDLYIVPERYQETHEALDGISPEPTSQHG